MKVILLIILAGLLSPISSQVILNADGKSDTYEQINTILAPNNNAVETPDCSHKEFGKHITQVFDNDLNCYVFQFHIHTSNDNDRCKKFDRQRNEIKTYKQSPDNLKATEGETVIYKWKFKLDVNFMVSKSFTHLHQLKAVGGNEENMPLITLTARKGDPNRLELRYARNKTQETIAKADLTLFKGNWVAVTETVTFGEEGKYSIEIKRVKDGTTLLKHEAKKIRTWKNDAEFLRPKWGIYRSLKYSNSLGDEIISFANISIEEIGTIKNK